MPNALFFRSGARSRSRFRILGVVAVVSVLLLCFLPSDVKAVLHTRGRLHSAGHFAVFFAVGYVLNRTSKSPLVRGMLFGMTLLLSFGTEFAEHVIYGTEVEWLDIGVDVMGAVVGTVLARYSSRRGVDRAAAGV